MATRAELHEHCNNNYEKYVYDADIKLEEAIVKTGDFPDSKVPVSLINNVNVMQNILSQSIKEGTLEEQSNKDVGNIENCEEYVKLEEFTVLVEDLLDSKVGIPLINDANKIHENIKAEICVKNTNEPTLQDLLSEDNENRVESELNMGLYLKANSRHIPQRGHNPKTVLCKKCNKTFNRRYYYYVHIHIHVGKTSHKCNICRKSFLTPYSLKRHKVSHSSSRLYTCRVCGERYTNIKDYERHRIAHFSNRPFSCGRCNKSFKYEHQLEMHKVSHKRTRIVSCPQCGKSYESIRILYEHIKNIHHVDKLSELTRSRKYNLKHHIGTDTVEKPFACEICEKTFNQQNSLKLHMKIHTGENTCDVCKRSFSSRGTLKAHVRIHTGEKPFTCESCGMSFRQAGDLVRHIKRLAGEKSFACEFCKRPFFDKRGLKKHLKTHTGEKSFTCEICNRSFNRAVGLKIHMRTHMGECHYSCKLCSAKFSGSKSLRRHKKLHTKAKD